MGIFPHSPNRDGCREIISFTANSLSASVHRITITYISNDSKFEFLGLRLAQASSRGLPGRPLCLQSVPSQATPTIVFSGQSSSFDRPMIVFSYPSTADLPLVAFAAMVAALALMAAYQSRRRYLRNLDLDTDSFDCSYSEKETDVSLWLPS